MIDDFTRIAPLLWPHYVFILLASWFGARSRTLMASVLVGASATALVTLVYYLVHNGVVADRVAPSVGQVLALFVAGAISLSGASIVSQVRRRKGTGVVPSLILGAVAGIILLVPTPWVQVRLACAFSGICP